MEFTGQVHALRLIFNVLLNNLLAYFSSSAYEVGSGPERRKLVEMIELISQNVCAGSFEPMNHLVGSVSSICLDEKVNVIRPNRTGANLPVVLFGHLAKHVLQTACHFVFENTRSSFHPSHEVAFHRAGGGGPLRYGSLSVVIT
jgi:hypothetical protein